MVIIILVHGIYHVKCRLEKYSRLSRWHGFILSIVDPSSHLPGGYLTWSSQPHCRQPAPRILAHHSSSALPWSNLDSVLLGVLDDLTGFSSLGRSGQVLISVLGHQDVILNSDSSYRVILFHDLFIDELGVSWVLQVDFFNCVT